MPVEDGYDTAQLAKFHRVQRDHLLSVTDWKTIRLLEQSGSIDPKWLSYRQALRDITAQPGFPDNVVWPTPPT